MHCYDKNGCFPCVILTGMLENQAVLLNLSEQHTRDRKFSRALPLRFETRCSLTPKVRARKFLGSAYFEGRLASFPCAGFQKKKKQGLFSKPSRMTHAWANAFNRSAITRGIFRTLQDDALANEFFLTHFPKWNYGLRKRRRPES